MAGFIFYSESYNTTAEVICFFRTLNVTSRLHRLLILNVILLVLFRCYSRDSSLTTQRGGWEWKGM